MSSSRPDHALREVVPESEREPLYADAFENAPHPMALIAPDGSILEANRALCRMLGFARDDLLDLNVSYITHPDDLDTETEQRRRLASADIGRYELVQRCLRKDRTSIWVHLSVSATRRNPSDASYFVAQLEGVPPHNRPTATEHDDRWLARVGDATLSAMHEIGNCLTPLMLNTEMIVEQSPRGEICESAEQIFKAARRIAFALRRLRGIQDTQQVAYLGQNRMLDLRMVAPPAKHKSDPQEEAGAA